jgi:UrcA family protein
MGTYRVSITAAIVGLVLGGGMAMPLAAAAAENGQVVVRFGDLNLATTAGAEALYTRIEAAARQVCPQADPVEMERHEVAMRCVQTVMAQAVSRIGNPQLAAVFAQRTHGTHRSV